MAITADYYTKPTNPSDGNVAYGSDVSNVNNETDAAFALVRTDMSNASLQSAASQAWAVGPDEASGTVIPTTYGGDGVTTGATVGGAGTFGGGGGASANDGGGGAGGNGYCEIYWSEK